MKYREQLNAMDTHIIMHVRKISTPLARIAIFVVFFWFGILKVIGASPANPLVAILLQQTLPFMTFSQFIVGFGIFEMIIGIVFLIPRLERLSMALLLPHMITTLLPLFLLPGVAWQAPFIPTLEGQYIIKNLAIIALAFGIAAQLTPWGSKKR